MPFYKDETELSNSGFLNLLKKVKNIEDSHGNKEKLFFIKLNILASLFPLMIRTERYTILTHTGLYYVNSPRSILYKHTLGVLI